MDDKVEIIIESKSYEISKSKLIRKSSYFNSMFNGDFVEKNESTVILKGISCNSWERIIYFIEHGKLQPEAYSKALHKELLDLLEAAAMLQFNDIKECCARILFDSIDAGNSLHVLEVASKLDLSALIRKARAVALWNSDTVSKSDAFFNLNADQVEGYLSDPALHNPEGEWGVWEAIDRWINSSDFNSSRIEFLPQLIKCIRFEKISLSDLRTLSLSESVRSSKLVSTAIKFLIKAKVTEKTEKYEKGENINSLIGDSATTEKNNEDEEAPIEVQEFISIWRNNPPRKLPLVPAVVAKVNRGKDLVSPYVVRFSEEENKFIPVIRLDEIETALGALAGFKVIADGSNLYMMGGEIMTRQSSWYHAVWQYDQIHGRWLFLANLHREGRHFSACVVGDNLYILGGFGRHRVVQDAVCKLSITERIWTTCAPLPQPMYSAPCCVFKGNIYVIQNLVYQYSPENDSWTSLDVGLFTGKVFCDAMVNNDYIFLSGRSKYIYKFNPSATSKTLEEVGAFKYECSQTCLIDNYIYSLSQDEFGEEIHCEKMDIETGQSKVLWEGLVGNEIANLNPNHHHGCFPLLLY